jgi:hypothetical protein
VTVGPTRRVTCLGRPRSEAVMTDEGTDRLTPSFLSRSRRKVQLVSCHSGLPFAGSLATVFLHGLMGINGIIAADNFPLPTQLAGVSVKVNGELAPILAVASLPGDWQQINFQVPFDRGLGQTMDCNSIQR